MSARSQQRNGFELPVRVTLVEGDLDEIEVRHDRLVDELASVKRVLVGILITLATASVMLALNLLVSQR